MPNHPAIHDLSHCPGIPVMMPGETFTGDTADILNYLKLYEDFDNRYPGFENEIHGIIIDEEQGKKSYSMYCIKK